MYTEHDTPGKAPARAATASAVIAALAFGCGGSGNDDVRLDDTFECEPRPDDESGYLEPICRYIADQFDTYPVDPNTLEIERIVPGDEVSDPAGEFDTADYDHVYLDCCYTGDRAIMDTSAREVVDFLLGDV